MAFELLVSAGVGYVAGAFTPSIGRKIKGLFVKEGAVVKNAAATEVASAIKSSAVSVAKKL